LAVQLPGRGEVRALWAVRGALQVRVKLKTPEPIGEWLPVQSARVQCQRCRARDGRMFYQSYRPDNLCYFITEIACEKCAREQTENL
jgi:hypothetical protein